MTTESIIIIGAGPSGLATGIQLKREGLDPLIIEKNSPGGLLLNANLVENYPGFPGGISGPELADLILKQTIETQVRIIADKVTLVEYEQNLFRVSSSENNYTSKILVLASGTRPRKIDRPHLPADCLDRVFYEVYPLRKVTDKKIAIIGAGDAAFDYALNLAGRNNRVWILNRSEKIASLELLVDRVRQTPLINYLSSCTIEEVAGNRNQLELVLDHKNSKMNLVIDNLLIAVGREPELSFLSNPVRNDLSSLQQSGQLYIVGDVTAGRFRQSAIASGDGIRTGMTISQLLKDDHR